MKSRCFYSNCKNSKLYESYHDNIWGRYIGSDNALFKSLVLETQHSGLSYLLILTKESGYRELFYDFDMNKISSMSDTQLNEILNNPKIIRNRLKIFSIRSNAIASLKIIDEFKSLDNYFKLFVKEFRAKTSFNSRDKVPTKNSESINLSKDMKKRGFKFVGPTTMYSFLEATGYYNNHLTTCFMYD